MQSDKLMTFNTFPKLLIENARKLGNKPAIRVKKFGIWQTRTWSQVSEDVRALACGLARIGFKRGNRLAIMGVNRPELYQAMAAAQSLGGIPVPLHYHGTDEEVAFVLNNADVSFVVVAGQEQVDRVLGVMNKFPGITVICVDYPWLSPYENETQLSYSEVLGNGRKFNDQQRDFYNHEVQLGRGEDISVILYTAGVTDDPKGVCLTYDQLIVTGRNLAEIEKLGPDEQVLAHLPMSFASDHMASYAQSIICGYCVNCVESAETFSTDLREIGPTYFLAPPFVFETMINKIRFRGESSGRITHRLYNFYMKKAMNIGSQIVEKKSVKLIDRALNLLLRWCFYAQLLDSLGLSRVRVAYSALGEINRDIFNLFRAFGLNLKIAYGLTEASVFVAGNEEGLRGNAYTVVKPFKNVEVKIGENREVLCRCPGVFLGYFNNPEATMYAKDAEGWLHTGDVGEFDPVGNLVIIGRRSSLSLLNDGTLFSPKYIENMLTSSGYIGEAVCLGHKRDFVSAIIIPNLHLLCNWAQRRNLVFKDESDLSCKPEVYDFISEHVEQVNRKLLTVLRIPSAQIRRFVILPKKLNSVAGEITRTNKVRRIIVEEKYAEMIDEIYRGKMCCQLECQIKSKGGSVKTILTELNIRDVKTFTQDSAAERLS